MVGHFDAQQGSPQLRSAQVLYCESDPGEGEPDQEAGRLMQDEVGTGQAEDLEILELPELGEVMVNVTGVVDISTVMRALPSTVAADTVVSREVIDDEEGEVSVWLVFRMREARAAA